MIDRFRNALLIKIQYRLGFLLGIVALMFNDDLPQHSWPRRVLFWAALILVFYTARLEKKEVQETEPIFEEN